MEEIPLQWSWKSGAQEVKVQAPLRYGVIRVGLLHFAVKLYPDFAQYIMQVVAVETGLAFGISKAMTALQNWSLCIPRAHIQNRSKQDLHTPF